MVTPLPKPTPAPDDDALARATSLGSREAFGALYARHFPAARRMVARLLSGDGDAQDVAQDAALKAFAALRRLKGKRMPPAFRPWFFRAVLNTARNRLRWRALRRVVLPEAPPIEPPLALLEQRQLRAALAAARAGLPARQREVLALRLDAGLAFAEVAEALGLTENNVKVSYHHAVKSLRRALQEEQVL